MYLHVHMHSETLKKYCFQGSIASMYTENTVLSLTAVHICHLDFAA